MRYSSTVAATGELRRDGGALRRRARKLDLLVILPGILLLLAVLVVPLGHTVWLSLHDVTVASDRPFIGLDNYWKVIASGVWWASIAMTAAIAITMLLTQLAVALVFATALHSLGRLWRVMRFVVLVPAALLPIVAAEAGRAAIDGGFLHNWLGLEGAGRFDSMTGVVLAETWRTTGIVVVILYIGLSAVPRHLVESAAADGATAWQRWRRVTLPALTPALMAATGYRLLDSWRLFDGPLLAGGPDRTATVVVWQSAFTDYELGTAAAASVVLVALTVVLALAAVGVGRWARAR